MDVILLRGDKVLSPVFRLEKPGAPSVILIGSVGMGSIDYYGKLEDRLTQGTGHFAGYERLHDEHPDSIGRGFYGRKLANVRSSLALRQHLAHSVGLRTRQTVRVGSCTIVTQSMQDAARLMSWTDAYNLSRLNRKMRQTLEPGADQGLRLKEHVGQYFLNLQALNNEHAQQRLGPWDRAQANQVLAFLCDAMWRGQEARQIVGVTRLAELVRLLKAEGYWLMGDVGWEPCTHMKHWRP